MPSSIDTNQTQFNVNVVKSEAVFEEMKKAGLPPRQIFMTPDVAGNIDNLRTEVIYDPADSTKNYGQSDGIQGGETISGLNLSNYSALIVHSYNLNSSLTLIYDMSNLGVQSVSGISNDNLAVMTVKCSVNAEKTSFTVNDIGYWNTAGYQNRNGTSYYNVYKIKGILKNPAAIYTGFGLDELLDRFYPVGSIYTSVDSISPASTLGGTWERIKDCFLWGTGDIPSITYLSQAGLTTDYLHAGEYGGQLVHQLDPSEIPIHSHTFSWSGSHKHEITDPKHSHKFTTSSSDSAGSYADTGDKATYSNKVSTSSVATGITINNTTISISGTTGNTGESKAHNNMPPYLAVYMWRRIS